MDKPFAITLDVGSSLANKTGAWRTERPIYRHGMPPCNNACPAGENIQQWLFHAESGDYEAAWRQLVRDNPFPAVMGRVCYHPCETACNRGQLDEAVGINPVERFIGDEAIRRGWTLPEPAESSGKHVLVIGAGPAGLSAAYHLRQFGHAVTVCESQDRPGGLMRYGIPRYRLPRQVLAAETDRLLATGITLWLNTRVDDLLTAQREGGFDAVFVGVGAGIGKRAYIPAGDSARMLDAVSLLHSVEEGNPPLLGRHVAVYGGGNTAIDAARTARRLGATDAVVIYRRTRDRMPAQALEVEEALEEGVRMRWLSTITRADAEKLTLERMRLDDNGFPQPTGEYEELHADSVVLALGQESDLSLLNDVTGLRIEHGVVAVGAGLMTGHPGIFAGGDVIGGADTVTDAIGNGKKAARHLDGYLRGVDYDPGPRHGLVGVDLLNTWYYSDAPASVRPRLDAARRTSTFDEVDTGLDESSALFEARRCLSCGNCFECDNCYGMCPDNAITKLGPGKGFRIDYDYCKGCGLCVVECPCGAIEMIPEDDAE